MDGWRFLEVYGNRDEKKYVCFSTEEIIEDGFD
jgi:hypothetical protein